jgi:hypothetical protein
LGQEMRRRVLLTISDLGGEVVEEGLRELDVVELEDALQNLGVLSVLARVKMEVLRLLTIWSLSAVQLTMIAVMVLVDL